MWLWKEKLILAIPTAKLAVKSSILTLKPTLTASPALVGKDCREANVKTAKIPMQSPAHQLM
jgi:hypothetical protein